MSAAWKKCSMEWVQHEESIITEWNFERKCTSIVHYSAQADNKRYVNRPLYTGKNKFCKVRQYFTTFFGF